LHFAVIIIIIIITIVIYACWRLALHGVIVSRACGLFIRTQIDDFRWHGPFSRNDNAAADSNGPEFRRTAHLSFAAGRR